MRYDILKEQRGRDISTEIAEYFKETRGLDLELMEFDHNDEEWSKEEHLMLRMWVHLNTDADGCYVQNDGSCVAPNQCPHSAEDHVDIINAERAEGRSFKVLAAGSGSEENSLEHR